MANQKGSNNSSAKLLFWIIGIAVVVIIGFIFLTPHNNQTTTSKKEKIDYSNQPYIGKDSAPVSIIEFGDYKCPNCKNFNESVIPLIKQELVDTGDAKLYFMNDSFIYKDSIRSAKFAESVYAELGNEAFWKFHDLLYQKQPEDSKYEKMDVFDEKFLQDALIEIASENDVKKVVRNFESKKSDASWQRDMDLAKQLNVTGTPTIFVNGKQFTGKTMNDLQNMVEKAAKEK